MYSFITSFKPEIAEFQKHRWRSLIDVLNDVQFLESYSFNDTAARRRSREHLDSVYVNKLIEPIFHYAKRFPGQEIMVNVGLTPYINVLNKLYILLCYTDKSNPEMCAHLAQCFYGNIQEFKRLLEWRVGVYSRESFESHFALQWKD